MSSHVLRAFDFALSRRAARQAHQLKRSDLEHRGRPQADGRATRRAEAQRVATARTLEFFHTYDLLLTPRPPWRRVWSKTATSPNAPARNSTIMSRLGIVCAIALVLPALSLPCGFTASGLRSDCRSGAAREQLLAGPRRWRTFWACAARRRSIEGPGTAPDNPGTVTQKGNDFDAGRQPSQRYNHLNEIQGDAKRNRRCIATNDRPRHDRRQ